MEWWWRGGAGDSGSESFRREWDRLGPELHWDPRWKELGFPRLQEVLTPLVMMTGTGHTLFSEGRRKWNGSSLPDLYCPYLFPNSPLSLLELSMA